MKVKESPMRPQRKYSFPAQNTNQTHADKSHRISRCIVLLNKPWEEAQVSLRLLVAHRPWIAALTAIPERASHASAFLKAHAPLFFTWFCSFFVNAISGLVSRSN